jgi:hypothetical protein
MLAALAIVPQTTVAYETLPLFLIPRTAREMGSLTGLSFAAYLLSTRLAPGDEVHHLKEAIAGYWPYWLILVYMPCLWMVLRRPSEHGERNTVTVLKEHRNGAA